MGHNEERIKERKGIKFVTKTLRNYYKNITNSIDFFCKILYS